MVALVLALSVSAWGATAGFELTFSNLSVLLNRGSTSLVPNSVTGYAQIAGWAGSPMEQVPDYLKQPRWGTYTLTSSYHGGPWLQEMTTAGVYDPSTHSAETSAKIVSNAPCPSPENVKYWGSERGFVNQGAWSVYNLKFNSPEVGWYQAHVTADYSYTITLDNSGSNRFGELDWAPELFFRLMAPYWVQPNYGITDIFTAMTPGTYNGHLDLDIGPEIYLFAGDGMQITMDTSVCTWNWGPTPTPVVPLPSSLLLLSSGILGLAGWRLKRKP
jgi:hypothetical protein